MTLLREIREHARMTAAELARRIGATPMEIWAYERGDCLPLAERQAKIAAVLGVKPQTIFDGVPKMGRKKGGHNRNPGIKKISPGQVRCSWCGNGTTRDIRIIGAGEDDRHYCSVHHLGEYLWTREKIEK